VRPPAARPPVALLAAAALAAVAALAWALGAAMPPPLSGVLAVVVVGLVATELLKRQPAQRALRLFHVYLQARERGADEPAARTRLLATFCRDGTRQRQLAPVLEAAWVGESEKDRVLGGVAALLAGEPRPIDPASLAHDYDRARDRFTIPGWEALPREFVAEIRRRLSPAELEQLDRLAETYRLFHQRFFERPVSLGIDPAARVADLARLLLSLGARLHRDGSADAERAYHLSLGLEPGDAVARAGLAVVLDGAGRHREAAREARLALEALTRHPASAPPALTPDALFPFRTPDALRQALERIAAAG
jgi:hypothetical protein